MTTDWARRSLRGLVSRSCLGPKGNHVCDLSPRLRRCPWNPRQQKKAEPQMNAPIRRESTNPYARAIAASKRARWEIDRDVLRGRSREREHSYLPDGLTLAHTVEFLSASERRFMSQVQGRSYANI